MAQNQSNYKKNSKSLDKTLKVAYIIGIFAILVILGFLLNSLSTPVSIIIWTVIFVFLLRGIVAKLESHGVNRVLGTAIAYIFMFVVFGLILFFMLSPAFGFGEQVKNMFENIPYYVELMRNWSLDMYNKYSYILQNSTIQDWINESAKNLGNIGSSVASAGANSVIIAGGIIGNTFMALAIALVIAFWILVELPSLGPEAKRLIPEKYSQDAIMWHFSITQIMAGYIKGTFIQCAIIGIVSGFLYWILGVSNPAALGCMTGVLNIIPIVGPWIGGAVAGIAGIFFNFWAGIGAFVGAICIQQIVYTFISPKIMSNSVNIHPVLTLFSMTVGGAIGGSMSGIIGSIVGMLISIPATAVAKSMFVYYYEKLNNRRIVAEDGVFFKGISFNGARPLPLIDAIAPSKKFLIKMFSSKEKTNFYKEAWNLDQDTLDILKKYVDSVKTKK